jgi:hypothetical protein
MLAQGGGATSGPGTDGTPGKSQLGATLLLSVMLDLGLFLLPPKDAFFRVVDVRAIAAAMTAVT